METLEATETLNASACIGTVFNDLCFITRTVPVFPNAESDDKVFFPDAGSSKFNMQLRKAKYKNVFHVKRL
jgi:hypothetical protein